MDETQTSAASNLSPECSSVQQTRSDPESSCVSMKSNQSMKHPNTFSKENTWPATSSVHQTRSDPESSCVSMKSNQSMKHPNTFSKEDTWLASSSVKQTKSDPESSCMSIRSNQSMKHPNTFRHAQSQRSVITEPLCKRRKSVDNPEDIDNNIDPGFSHASKVPEALSTFKRNLREKCLCLCGETSKQGTPTQLNEIYTELYITESESGETINEHEVRQIEMQYRRTTEDTPIKCNDIFKPSPAQEKPIRSVLTKGVAGIGKTVSVQKFILDWAEENANQEIQLIFPLPFKELNFMKEKKLNLLDLLHFFFPETKEREIPREKYKVLFIFDGLDEYRLSLDFHKNVRLCDVTESASVDILLTNLIKGNLFPSALIWITSRPAAADLIPSECFDRVTEVRGFSDPQKEEYFSKRISDENLANRIISHLKSSRSLYIMCHIPVFCRISATVLERMLSEAESEEIPKTLTQMYTHFLIFQTNVKHQKNYKKKVKDEEMIFKLGKLAFEQLIKGNLIFYDEDLRECGIDVEEGVVYSGLCTQIFREEFGFYQGKVYSFVHLSIQEHLAALYAHLMFINHNMNMFNQMMASGSSSKRNTRKKQVLMADLHQTAVDKALQSKNGHLDLFLRFLLGFSHELNHIIIQELLTLKAYCSIRKEKTAKYIKKKIRENPSPEKSINLFHCLNELGDCSVMEEVQQYLKSRKIRQAKFSPLQWSAMVYILLTSNEELGEFNLGNYILPGKASEERLLQLLPVVKASRSAHLSKCKLSEKYCAALELALSTNDSCLKELNFKSSGMQDSGVKLLSTGLESPLCKLEVLRLSNCNITSEGCAYLASALTSNSSHLRELDLSENKFGDLGLKQLSAGLENPHCTLEILRLLYCNITQEGCAGLASALRSNPSHLTELDLSMNKLVDSGVKLLSDGLKDPQCKLNILELSDCGVTGEGCAYLASALRSNPLHLTELNLSDNKLGDSGVKLLSAGLENPQCKLKKIRLKDCGVTKEGCAALTAALRLNPSHLTELNLSKNKIGDLGLKLLSDGLENPHCQLQILRLSDCDVTGEGCAYLASALRSNPSHLTELDLAENNIGDSGMTQISAGLGNPHCKLKILMLYDCNITGKGCAALSSALRLNPSHLSGVDLSENNLGDLGMKHLSAGLENPQCKLQKIRLRDCGITGKGCADLASALRSNPSHLRELHLAKNKLGDSGVKLICAVLADLNCKLEILCFWNCDVTDEGCDALASALRSNLSNLTELHLSENNLGDSGVKLFAKGLGNPHCKLEKIRLWRCGITDDGCADLVSALRLNASHLREIDMSGNKLGDLGVKLLSELKDDPHCKLEEVIFRI